MSRQKQQIMNFDDELNRVLAEEQNVKSFYGYRTFHSVDQARAIAISGIKVNDTTETYWSFKPILYTYHPGPVKNHVYSNLIEVRFLDNDRGLCGFGDNGYLYLYITAKSIPADVEKIASKLSSADHNLLDSLRSLVVNDKRFADDWTFTGILPNDLRMKVVRGLQQISSLSFRNRFIEHEFAFVGPINEFDNEKATSITGVYLFEFENQSRYHATDFSRALSIETLFNGLLSNVEKKLTNK